MRKTHLMLAAAVAFLGVAGSAAAHTPYLAPVTFAPDREYVTVQGAMSESHFFVPDFPLRGGADYWATGPSGEAVGIGPGVNMKEMTIIEVPLPQEGTWKISTGDRSGRVARFAKIGAEWKAVRALQPQAQPQPQPAPAAPGAASPEAGRMAGQGGGGRGAGIDEKDIPAGAEITESVGVLKAETYVTRGAPSKGALKATGKGFEVTPVTHPNEIFAGDALKVLVTVDGKPASDVTFSIARAFDSYSEKKFAYEGKTDAAGAAAITFAEPGAYVLEAHYGQAAPGAKPSAKSYTYSLSFEVTK